MANDSDDAASIALVEEDEAPLNSTINTTPLVDIMLVMLIIFLITIPVAVSTVPVELPIEENRVLQIKPENINVSVDSNGNIYINQRRVDEDQLLMELRLAAVQVPQPEVHVRGDTDTQYLNVGKVVESAQRAGIMKIGFVTRAPTREF